MSRGEPSRTQAGFTLIEMLVALAVFSLVALALIRLQAISVRTTADLGTRQWAQVVADNMMAELLTDPVPPALGEVTGEVANAGRTWRWTRNVTRTDDTKTLQVRLTVERSAGGGPRANLVFLRTDR